MNTVRKPYDLTLLKAQLAKADEADGPLAAWLVIQAIYEMLADLGFDVNELRPVYRLLGALEDLERGKPNPLLARKPKKGGGLQFNAADNIYKTNVAAAITLFRGEGYTKADAIRKVAASVKGDGVEVSIPKIGSWHHQISNDLHPEKSVKDQYYYLVEWGRDRDGAANIILGGLPTLTREKL